jgi:ATP-binding cassette subfamily B protein
MGHISYSNVTFSYESGQSVLNGVSFELPAGSKLALVGESGEGKTTISNLLLRFYEIKSGSITIDGQDISQITQESLRENIGVVFQEPALFSGTVRDNIAYGRRDASDEDVERAAEAANATGFIVKLPQGINTEIGERGVKLSGGQKQRIAIARAILKDSPILILDEATSSLDSRAEHEVQMALEELMKGRTTLIIAHRLSTIASADIIIGIQGGKVIEQGSPSELAKSGGIYAELLALQSPTAANKAKLKKYDIAR